MRRTLVGSLVAGCLVVVSAAARAEEPRFSVAWVDDVDKGFELARERRQAVLIDFFADWCPPCREMDQSVWTNPHVGEAAKRTVLVRVDFDKEKSLARRYGVDAIPTMVFVDPWGIEIGRIVGLQSSGEMVLRFESVPGNFAAVAAYQSRLEKNGNDAEALVRIGAFYRSQKLLIGADAYFERAIQASGKGKRDPLSGMEAYLGLGLDHMDRGNYKEAAKQFERCVKNVPNASGQADALFGLVVARARMGDKKRALKDLERLAREFPDYPSLDEAKRIVAEASGS
jgi:thioredoxin-like negative regulator of GroEL